MFMEKFVMIKICVFKVEHYFFCFLLFVIHISRLPSISNISLSRTKCLVPWNFPQEHCIAFLYFELLYIELFPISKNFPVPWTIFSLYLEHLHIRILFLNSQINSNLNQNKNFDRKWKTNLFFVLSGVKTKLSVKRNRYSTSIKNMENEKPYTRSKNCYF